VAHLLHFPPLLTADVLRELRLLGDYALALILVNIGGQFRTETLKRFGRRILFFSAGEILFTAALVALATAGCNYWLLRHSIPGYSLATTSLILGMFLGIIAAATAPAATLMVIREYEAEGPVTSTVLTLVGLNNLAAILAFTFTTHLLFHASNGLWGLLLRMAGPIVIGGLAGFLLSAWAQRLELESEYKILVLGAVGGVTAAAHALHLDPLLASLALGMVMANSSPRWHRIADSLHQIDYPLYVVFFVLAGANLHLETLAQLGLLGIAYVVTRIAGKLVGGMLGARLGSFDRRQVLYAGSTLLGQGGVAIGLATSLGRGWPEGGHMLQTVVLGSVVIFELVGPLALRFGLIRAGEVPILSLLRKRAPEGTLEGLHSVVSHFSSALGLPVGRRLRDPGDILVKHIMRRNVETIRNDTPFHDLLHLIAHSRYDRFPVVDADDNFVGMIAYSEIRSLLFEPSLTRLVVASDLTTSSSHALSPEQSLREALRTLELNRNISYFPVLDPDNPRRLVGILSQNEVFAAFRRLNRNA
ncbi:MAG TPA: cation:proton antiporter, partial [Desulfuromonadales bacterium]|nr:cation:proton antiporter [Desulfuromonadales bacterium]